MALQRFEWGLVLGHETSNRLSDSDNDFHYQSDAAAILDRAQVQVAEGGSRPTVVMFLAILRSLSPSSCLDGRRGLRYRSRVAVQRSRRDPSTRPPRLPPEKDVSSRVSAISKHLKDRGLKHSAVRDVVVEEFFAARTHVSIEQLLERVRARVPATGYSTVYRTLRLLVDGGFATARDFGGACTLFEPADTRHHDHVVCLKCGAVREFEETAIEELQERVARRLGFRITSHRLELYGLCASCAAPDR